MKNNPMVSVGVTFYNQERFVASTLTSVLNQKTNFPFEIVAGDDYSSDNSRIILKKFQQDYPDQIRVIYNPQNLGLLRNTKNILDHCQGKYIALLGGDDFYSDELKLQKQYDFLEQNPDYGIVHADSKILIEKNIGEVQVIESAEKFFKLKVNTGNVYEDLLQKCYIFVCTSFFKKELYKNQEDLENWFNLGFKSEDYPLWLSFSLVTKFGYIKEPLATYRILPNTLSRLKDESANFKYWLSSKKITFYFLDKYGASPEIKSKVCEKSYRFYLEYSLYFSDKKLSQEAYDYFQKVGDRKLIYLLYYWGARSKIAWFLLKVLRKLFKSLRILDYGPEVKL